MEYTTIQKNLQNSPRKLRLVADMIRKMSPSQAVEVLEFANQAAAVPLSKAIKTALANAGKDDVVFKKIEINEGMKLKRYRAGTAGRGRGRPYKKRWSHIKIVLTDETQVKTPVETVRNVNRKTKANASKNILTDEKAAQIKSEIKEQLEEKIVEKETKEEKS